MENAADELAWHAQLESYLGNYALARKLCRQAGEAGKDSNLGLGHCAKALAEAGDVTQAEALAAKLDRLRPEDTLNQQVHLPLIRSIIERERGNAVKAVDLLAPVTQYEQGEPQVLYHRAQAYLAAGEHPRPPPSSRGLSVIADGATRKCLLRWRNSVSRGLCMQGDRENSRKAYDDFFTTWKDADPDIPILRQAKAEYKKLTATASVAASPSGKKQ
jgi:hypothetical protein